MGILSGIFEDIDNASKPAQEKPQDAPSPSRGLIGEQMDAISRVSGPDPVRNFLGAHAHEAAKMGQDYDESEHWNGVASDIKERFPDQDPAKLRKDYNRLRSMEDLRSYQDLHKDESEPGPFSSLSRGTDTIAEHVPLMGTLAAAKNKKYLAEALRRMEAGEAQPGDASLIAEHEREGRWASERSTLERGLRLGLSLPKAMVEFSPGFLPATLAAGAVAGHMEGKVPQVDYSGDTIKLVDPENKRNALKGLGETAIMAYIGKTGINRLLGETAGTGVGAFLKNTATSTTRTVLEMRAADVLMGVTKIRGDYGTVGDFLEGRDGKGFQQIAAEYIGFGLFGIAHKGVSKGLSFNAEKQGNRLMEAVDALQQAGVPKDQIPQGIRAVHEVIDKGIADGMSRDQIEQEIRQRFKPNTPLEAYASGFVAGFPEQGTAPQRPEGQVSRQGLKPWETAPPQPGQAPTQPEPPPATPPVQEQPPVPVQPPPEPAQPPQAPVAPPTAEIRSSIPEPAKPEAAVPPPQPAPKRFAAWSDADVKDTGKALYGKAVAGMDREQILDFMRKELGSDEAMRQFEKYPPQTAKTAAERVIQPLQRPVEPPEQPQTAELPQTEPPVASEPVRPAEAKPEPVTLEKAYQDSLKGVMPTADVMAQGFKEAGLNPRQVHLLLERLKHRTFEDIANDPEIGLSPRTGKPYSKERLEQIEKAAMEKIGAAGKSVEKTVHLTEKESKAIDRLAKGQLVSAEELHNVDPTGAARRQAKDHTDKVQSVLDDLIDSYATEKKEGTLTPEKEKEYERELSRLSEEATRFLRTEEAAPANVPERPTKSRGRVKASIRRAEVGSVPEGAPLPETGAPGTGTAGVRADQGQATPRPAETAGRSEADIPANPPPAAERSQASGNKLTTPPKPEEYIPPPAAFYKKNRQERDFGFEERQLRKEGTHTVAQEVRNQGGIRPESLTQGERESWVEAFGDFAFRNNENKKGTVNADQMADILFRSAGARDALGEQTGGKEQWLFDAMAAHHPLIESDATAGRKMQQGAHEQFMERLRDHFATLTYPNEAAREKAIKHWIKTQGEPAYRENVKNRVMNTEEAKEHGKILSEYPEPQKEEAQADADATIRETVARAEADEALRRRLEGKTTFNDRDELVGEDGEVLFGPGSPSAPGGSGNKPGSPGGRGVNQLRKSAVGPFEINKTIDEKLDMKSYHDTLPGATPQDIAYLARQKAAIVGNMRAGDSQARMHEAAHHIAIEHELQTDPAKLPGDVAAGLKVFDYDPQRPIGKVAMMEGFAEWLRRRQVDDLNNLSPAERAAADYAEKFVKEAGLDKPLDEIRDLFRDNLKQSPEQQTAGLVSPTGRPAEPVQSVQEKALGMWERVKNWFDEKVLNNLSVLKRAGMEKAYTQWMRLMFADKSRADQWAKEGVGTIQDGKYTIVGPTKAEIVKSLTDPLDLQPVDQTPSSWLTRGLGLEPKKVTKAGLYALTRHILYEAEQGRSPVPEEQLAKYQATMDEFQKDQAFVQRADAFADRLTKAYNSTLDALASPDVHRLSQETVDYLREKRPNYLPTTRVKEDMLWRQATGARRHENMAGVLFERTGSGEQIVDPMVNYETRLRSVASQFNEQLRRNAVAEYLQQPEMGKWGLAVPNDGKPVEGDAYEAKSIWPKDGTKPTWYWYGPEGKLTNFRIGDRSLYDLITGQQAESNYVSNIFKALAGPGFNTPWGAFNPLTASAGLVRQGATAFSLAFQVRNALWPFRDPYEFTKNTIDQASLGKLPGALKRAYAYEVALLAGKVPGDAVFELFARERGREQRKFGFETPGIETVGSKVELVKQALNTMGAGELGPRFLEFTNKLKEMGWPEARLERELQAAKEAQARGEQYQDPLPWEVLQTAMEAGNEVTVPFSRQGVITREINKIVPFFGPAVAGMSKAMRNWRDNPRGALIALGGFLSLRLMYFQMFSDEKWYQELSSHDRYNNFVMPVPGLGLRRFPGPRDLEVPIGGMLTTILEVASGQNPDFKGLLKESYSAIAPPAPVPPLAKVPLEIATNQNWMGSPIVPKRDERLSGTDKFLSHQLPYAAEQLTGGRANFSEKGIQRALVPFSDVKNARRSIDEFYSAMKDMEAERLSSTRKGMAYEAEAKYQRMHSIDSRIKALSMELRGQRRVGSRVVQGDEPGEERKAQIRQAQTELARQALGR